MKSKSKTRKTDTGFISILSKFHPASGFCLRPPNSRFLSTNTHNPLKGQSPSRHTIVRATLRFLYLPPRLMDIPTHFFRQSPLLRQFPKRLYQVSYGILRTIHIIKILPVPIHHKVSAHGFRQLQEHQCCRLVFSNGKQRLNILVLLQHQLPDAITIPIHISSVEDTLFIVLVQWYQ